MRFFYRGAYFTRREFRVVRKYVCGIEIKWVRGIERMRQLKKVNVPNTPQQQIQSNEYRVMNKRKLRRFILVFIFIFSATFYVQYILNKQQEIIVEKRDTINNQQKQLLSLKKDSRYLKSEVANLTDNEEEILKYARKEYQFSKSNETIFILPK